MIPVFVWPCFKQKVDPIFTAHKRSSGKVFMCLSVPMGVGGGYSPSYLIILANC